MWLSLIASCDLVQNAGWLEGQAVKVGTVSNGSGSVTVEVVPLRNGRRRSDLQSFARHGYLIIFAMKLYG
jgi:hypothetical protein